MNRVQLEDLVSKYKLSFSTIRDSAVENARYPSFVKSFYASMDSRGTLPTQEEFVSDYAEQTGLEMTAGLEARLRRTYPSLVRELHARLLAMETFEDVSYSVDADYKHGIDLTIHHGGEDYHIHLFVDTRRGNHFRLAKDTRHRFSGHHIDISLNLREGRPVGDFLFYPEATFESLKSNLEKLRNQSKGA